MARDDASVRLTVAQRQALAALNQFQSKFEQMTRSMAGNTARQTRAAEKTNKTLARWGKNLKTAALSMAGFASAGGAAYTIISVIRKELQTIERTADRMKDRQLSFGQAAMQVGFSLPEKDGKLIDMDINDITKRLEDERDPAMAMRVFRNIHGANADLALSGKVGIVEELMAKRFDLSESAMTELGVQIADNHAKAIAKGINSSVSSQIGLFEGSKAASKVTDDAAFFGNIAPIGLDLQKFGVNQGESMLLAAGLSSAANDRTGTETRTALSKLFASLEEEKARFGIKESGLGLLRSVREGKSDAHKRFQRYMLGVFADGEEIDFLTMSRREAALKLEGRSKMKFYLMDLLRQKTEDPTNLLNVMNVIKKSGQIPLSFKGDTFQVDMNKTMERAAEYFGAKLAQINENKRIGLYVTQQRFKKANAELEMENYDQAKQKVLKDELLTMLQNAGVKMSWVHSNLEYYTGQYGSDKGLEKALHQIRGHVATDHPQHGVWGKTYRNGWNVNILEEDISRLPLEEIKKLKYKRLGVFYDYDKRGISDQQVTIITKIDQLIDELRSGKISKVEVTNLGSFDTDNAARKLGDR